MKLLKTKPTIKPNTSLKSRETNKLLEDLKPRRVLQKGSYKKRIKDIDLEIKQKNSLAKPGEHYFFNGKEIVKFNYNHVALSNISKILTPKDKKALLGVSAEISLRISKEIIRKKLQFTDNSGNIKNMTPMVILSLPIDKLKTLITKTEYKKLFSILKRMPEKNLNYIVNNYKEINQIAEKNKYVFCANVLLKTTIAQGKGLLLNVSSLKEKLINARNNSNLSFLEGASSLKEKLINARRVSNENLISKMSLESTRSTSKYPLSEKYLLNSKAFNPTEIKKKYGEKYFKELEVLLKKFKKDFPGKELTQIQLGLFNRFISERLEGQKGAKKPLDRYKKYSSEFERQLQN